MTVLDNYSGSLGVKGSFMTKYLQKIGPLKFLKIQFFDNYSSSRLMLSSAVFDDKRIFEKIGPVINLNYIFF